MSTKKAEVPLRVAVISRDGYVQYRQFSISAASESGLGRIVYPFRSQPVYSNSWKASSHTKLLPRGENTDA